MSSKAPEDSNSSGLTEEQSLSRTFSPLRTRGKGIGPRRRVVTA